MMGGGWCNLILDQKNQKKTTINQLAREKPNQRSGKKISWAADQRNRWHEP
jgi:hypothetical protein